MPNLPGITPPKPERSAFQLLRSTVRKGLQSGSVSNGLCAILDQAVTSGGRFVSTILVGRACGAEGLGLYALGISIAMIALAVQHSVITAPYTVFLHRLREDKDQKSYAGSMLAVWLVLAVGIGLLLVTSALARPLTNTLNSNASFFRVLSIGVPFLLLREFARQLAFAKLKFKVALLIDTVAASLQTIGLVVLMTMDLLTPVTAWWAIIAAYGGTCGVWLLLNRTGFQVRLAQVPSDFRQNWRLGRWDMASNVMMNCQLYLVHWCLAWWVGVEATGEYAACATVLLFANPIVMGLSNYLMPRVSRTLSTEGLATMNRFVRSAAITLVGAMIVFSVVAISLGPLLLQLLFQLTPDATHRVVIAILAMNATVGALGVSAEWALLAMERPQTNFYATSLGLAVTSVIAVTSVSRFGMIGASAGLLLGTVLSVSYIWTAYYVASRQQIAATQLQPSQSEA